ncbi:TIM barrel protein [Rhizobium leguminosarum bv. viciae]|uniref:sugar phosphate isomerase/epimerase family protein n=1 Tax=Rhizobium leguminosarum TaxID=384 RepID=UPI001440F305|nr:sugar phosphate isomerase/epimerase [Rhizobium leguminosarum]NKK04050.1 TIM barrel protein [Rhizobium leguminosarum bv. viciae]
MAVLSVQLYTLREIDDVDRMLDVVTEAGFRHVEVYGALFSQASVLRRKLDERGLKVSGAHVSLQDLKDVRSTVDQAAVLDVRSIFVPSVPVPLRDMAPAGWRELGRDLALLSDELGKHALTIGYHTHDWDFRPKEDGKAALDIVFEAAGTAPVEWEADIAWLARAGVDPKLWLERYRSRLTAAHVKDLAPVGTNDDEAGWADVGSGTLDWSDLWPFAVERGAKVMVVEHDKPLNPARTIMNGFRFISERLL